MKCVPPFIKIIKLFFFAENKFNFQIINVSCNNCPSANVVCTRIDIFIKLRFHHNAIIGLCYCNFYLINNCFVSVFVFRCDLYLISLCRFNNKMNLLLLLLLLSSSPLRISFLVVYYCLKYQKYLDHFHI